MNPIPAPRLVPVAIDLTATRPRCSVYAPRDEARRSSRGQDPRRPSPGQDPSPHRPHEEGPQKILALRDGEQVVTASWDNTLRLFLSSSGECLRTFTGHHLCVSCVARPDNGTLMSVGHDQTVRIWRVSDSALLETVKLCGSLASGANLGYGYFFVGMASGELPFLHWTGLGCLRWSRANRSFLTTDTHRFDTRHVYV